MNLFIDVHALHTVPPSNLNRDDTGAPKSATFGGVPRHRVSSQAWKRAIRKDFANYMSSDQLGTRTKRVVEQIARRVVELQGTPADQIDPESHGAALSAAAESAEALLKTAGFKAEKPKKRKQKGEADDENTLVFAQTEYLAFLSNLQIRKAAEQIAADPEHKWTAKEAKALLDTDHSVDIAMFGRMLADAPDLNVDAAVQVAHALGVSASEPEFDYFTAVDDAAESAEETGAGMIGTVEFTSSTLYRYATVNLHALEANLGDAALAHEAVSAFIQAFITSMPSGKQNTFANTTLPDVVVVSVRTDRPVSWVNAFEEPVLAEAAGGRRDEAAGKLAAEALALETMYDAPAARTWVITSDRLAERLEGLGERANRTQMLDQLKAELESER